MVLPEMVFAQNRVELVHEASGTVISFNALDALAGWKYEDLAPLQVRVAEVSLGVNRQQNLVRPAYCRDSLGHWTSSTVHAWHIPAPSTCKPLNASAPML